MTYNRTLPNIKQIKQNHWSILKSNKSLEKTFSTEPITVFRKKKPKKLIGRNYQNDKKSRNKSERKCTPCKSETRSLCCSQVQNTHSFCSQYNGRMFTIFHQVNGKRNFVIYLLECEKCYIQHVGKAELDSSIRLNYHRKDVYKADAIPDSCHFATKDHIFKRNASFIIIEPIGKSNSSRETKMQLLKQLLHHKIRNFKT